MNLDDTSPLIVAEFSQGITQKRLADDGDILSLRKKQPIAILKLASSLENVEKEFPVFRGQNYIGRLKSCEIYLPHPKVSKQHACIEIGDDAHFVFDCDSLNKTKRNTHILIPRARYELTNDVLLTFADVECRYTIISDFSKTSNEGISQPPTAVTTQKPSGSSLLSKCFSSGNESPDLLSQELEIDDDEPFESVLAKTRTFVEDSPMIPNFTNFKKRDDNQELSVVKESQSFFHHSSNNDGSLRLNLTSSDEDDDEVSSVDGKNVEETDAQAKDPLPLPTVSGCSAERILNEILESAGEVDLGLQEILHGPSKKTECLFIGETAPFFEGTPIDIRKLRKKSVLSALDLWSPGTRDDDDELTSKADGKKVSFEKYGKPEEKASKHENAAATKLSVLPSNTIGKKRERKTPPKSDKPLIDATSSTDKARGDSKRKTRGQKSIADISSSSKDRKKKAISRKAEEETTVVSIETPEPKPEKNARVSRKTGPEKVEIDNESDIAAKEKVTRRSNRGNATSTPISLVKTHTVAPYRSKKPAAPTETISEPQTDAAEKGSSSRKTIKISQNTESSQTSQGKRKRSQKIDSSELKESPKKKNKVENCNFKIAFTGIPNKSLEPLEKIVKDFGCSVEDSLRESSHLVAEQVKRTAKFLCAVARGIPIVSPEWLKRSKSNGGFVDPTSFLLIDPAAEKNYEFRLRDTLQKAKSKPLFVGFSVFVTPSVSKPPPSELEDIITCAGGKFITKLPTKRNSVSNAFVVSCEEDKQLWSRMEKLNLKLVSVEFVLSGLLKHELDFDMHRLA